MNRYLLLENIREMLSKSGFELSDELLEKVICFDFLARRGETLLIIKVLVNIDSFNKHSAMEMRVVSNFLDGSPLVVGNRGGGGPIEDGAVYLRHSIPIMSPQTIFEYLVEDSPPIVSAGPGGFFVKIDGEMLKKARHRQERLFVKQVVYHTRLKVSGIQHGPVERMRESRRTLGEVSLECESLLSLCQRDLRPDPSDSRMHTVSPPTMHP